MSKVVLPTERIRKEDLYNLLIPVFNQFGNSSDAAMNQQSINPFISPTTNFLGGSKPPDPYDYAGDYYGDDNYTSNFTGWAYEGDYVEGFDVSELNPDERSFKFLVEGVILTIVSIFGIIGTVMSIGVLVKPAVRESFSALLTGLAICDTLFLLTSLIMFGLPKLWLWFAIHVTTPATPYTFGMIGIFRVGSTLLTLSVTIERYCAICHPLNTSKLKQKYLLIASLVFAVTYNLPKFFEIYLVYLPNGEIVTQDAEMRSNIYYRQFYMFWSKFIFIELVPYFTIIILNTLILMKTVKASKFRRRFTEPPTSTTNFRSNSVAMETQLNRKASQMTECVPLQHMNCGNTPPTLVLNGDNDEDPMTERTLLPPSQNSKINMLSPDHYLNGKSPVSSTSTDVPASSQSLVESKNLLTRNYRKNSRHLSVCSMIIAANVEPLEEAPRRTNSVISLQIDKPHVGRARSVSQAILSKLPSAKISVTAHKDKALGATLIGVSVLFVSCQSIKLIPDFYEGFICGGYGYCESNKLIMTFITISNLMTCINSSANFLMYMVRGTKFRRAFINTYTNCFRKIFKQ